VVLFTALLNLFVGSASAKWALLAPVLAPMLILLGISPEMTTAAYRVGDSATNIITPLMVYFPLILIFCQRWRRTSASAAWRDDAALLDGPAARRAGVGDRLGGAGPPARDRARACTPTRRRSPPRRPRLRRRCDSRPVSIGCRGGSVRPARPRPPTRRKLARRALAGASRVGHIAPMTVHPAVPEAALPEWSLEDLYAGRGDPRLKQDLQAAAKAALELKALEGSFLTARGQADRLGLMLSEGIALYERVANLLGAVGGYAGLQAAVARDDPDAAKFEADVREQLAGIGAESLFFTLELNQLERVGDGGGLSAARPEAERWRPWLRGCARCARTSSKPGPGAVLIDRGAAGGNWSAPVRLRPSRG
jgi:hypothetical protein